MNWKVELSFLDDEGVTTNTTLFLDEMEIDEAFTRTAASIKERQSRVNCYPTKIEFYEYSK